MAEDIPDLPMDEKAETDVDNSLAGRVSEITAGISPGFADLIDHTELKKVLKEIDQLGDTDNIEPPANLMFEWLRYFPPRKTVGCIIGQDPYPNDACGISFSKLAKHGMTKSFEPLVKCLEAQNLMKASIKNRHADLRPWVLQGLLMPNMALTTRKGVSKVHQKIWKKFMTDLIKKICEKLKEEGVEIFFILWGAEAKAIATLARKYGHAAFTWSHPSPLGDKQQPEEKKFKNCTNFTQANEFLKSKGLSPFCWENMGSTILYVDGACSGNGKDDATGGFGLLVLGGHLSQLKASGAVPATTFELIDANFPELGFRPTDEPTPPTNNRAELLALCWAFLILIRGRVFGSVEIVSDSGISVNTLNKWLPNRKAKGTEADLANPDLISIADALLGLLKKRAASVKLRHVRAAHDYKLKPNATQQEKLDWFGNTKADLIAVDAKLKQSPFTINTKIPLLESLAESS